jgi:hypothetical protein
MMYPVEAFILSKFYDEYQEWVDEQEANRRAAFLEEQERNRKPFDLDKMVEEALAVVQKTVQESRHNYTPLAADDKMRKKGFLTKEGVMSYENVIVPKCILGLGLAAYGRSGSVIQGESKPGSVIQVGEDGDLWWVTPTLTLCSLFGLVFVRKSMPRWLLRFVKDVPDSRSDV